MCGRRGRGGARGRRGIPAARPRGWPRAAGAAGLTAWAGLSTVWSIAGDRSWEWFGRGLVYLSFLALGLLAGAVAGGARRVAALLAVVLGAALGWALLGVAIPSLFEDGDRIARLREPVGYWNALALLADGALALGLWLARDVRVSGCRRRGRSATSRSWRCFSRSRGPVLIAGILVLVLWLCSRTGDSTTLSVLRSSPSPPSPSRGGRSRGRPSSRSRRYERIASMTDVFAVLAVIGVLRAVAGVWLVPVRRLVSERRRPS